LLKSEREKVAMLEKLLDFTEEKYGLVEFKIDGAVAYLSA
jgi:hypothetical protein